MKKIIILILLCLIIFQFCCLPGYTAVQSSPEVYSSISNNQEKIYKVLEQYKKIASEGGWQVIPDGNRLKRGDFKERVVFLRNRLILSGDLKQEDNKEWLQFDDRLETAVKVFQKRHGLHDNGIVGIDTIQALNVSVQERVHQIEMNVDRMELFPENPGKKYILVNIPDFKLIVINNKVTELDIRIIVGKVSKPTPQLKSKIYYLVLNPAWNIPFNIAVNTHLPLINKNPYYFTCKDIKVFKGWGSNKKEYDPQLINWNLLNKSNFNYRLVQQPGPDNPMGQVKFKFPNSFSVCLHGTPDKYLFMNKKRAFSSGCIRLEEPVKLAVNLLKNSISEKKIYEIIKNNNMKTIELDEPLPIYLVYYTAWVSNKAVVNFRNDIYNYDK